MLKNFILVFLILFSISNPTYASIKKKIINNLTKTDNLEFEFKQTIGEKTENGNCIIQYPKKIYCSYENTKKIMVSNGKYLVIKNLNNNQYYNYQLKKTPLELLLDKNFLISQINILESRDVDDKYIGFTIPNNKNKINIFFDKKTLKLNQNIDRNKFKLPKMN